MAKAEFNEGTNIGKVGIFGVGPGSIAAIDALGNKTTVFQRAEISQNARRSTYTNSKGYEQLFDRYVPEEFLMPMNSFRFLSTSGADFTIPTNNGNYWMVNYPEVMKGWRTFSQENASRIETLPRDIKQKDIKIEEEGGMIGVTIEGNTYEFDSVIDGTGTPSLLAPHAEPKRKDENYLSNQILAGTFRGSMQDGQMIVVSGPAGGFSWLNPSVYKGESGEPLIDVCFSSWGWKNHFDRFKQGDGRQRLNILLDFLQEFPDINFDREPLDLVYGQIRSERTPKPQSKTIFAVGEAGGTAKPISGESFNRALEAGEIAAQMIQKGKLPRDYYKEFYGRHSGDDLLMSMGLAKLPTQKRGEAWAILDRLQSRSVDSNFQSQVESFFLDGKTSPGLLLKILLDTQTAKGIFESFKILMRYKRGKIHRSDEYPLPDINNQEI